jgi:hypothetical protein
MIEPIITEWRFEYKHSNHAVFTGVIKAVSEKNRDAIMLNLLYSRFRRKLELSSKYGNVIFEEIFK